MIVTLTNVCELCGHRHDFQGRVYGDWEGDDNLVGPDNCEACKALSETVPKIYKLALDSYNKYKKEQYEKIIWKQKYINLRIKAGL